MRKRFTLLTLSFLCLFLSVRGQELPITLKILDHKGQRVPSATITIVNRIDSLQVLEKVADSIGTAQFKLHKGAQYNVKITAVNYQPIEKGIVITGDQSSFTFYAEPMPKTLSAVVVTAQKPMIRQEDDKTIVDPENLVAASTNGYEVIEKTPGLFVDQDGNIYITSFTPATVQINGREMRMSASDVATMLKSLPPNAISKIEIVRTPSAKYDASSSGGVVNVVLKKGIKIGMTGSVQGGFQQGTYGNQFTGFNLSNSDGRKSSFLNVNYNKRNSYEKIVTDRFFAPDSVLSQRAFTKYPGDSWFVGYGIDNELGEKWTIDFSGSASLNHFNNATENRSAISKISTGQLLTDNLNQVGNKGYSINLRNSFEALLEIDSLGSEWETDISYNFLTNQSDQVFSTSYIFPPFPQTGGDGSNETRRHFLNAKSDLVLKLKKRLTVEAGIKATFQDFRSIANYFKESGGTREKDARRTNTFEYDENINAAYLQASKTLGKDIVIKVGTRVENTNMQGRQIIPSDTTFDVHRTDLFPYVYLSKSLMKIAGYSLRAYLVARRTISRPGYEQLNPFQRYIDQYLTETGNPSLLPQFTQNYEANISVDERPILAVGINDTKNIFSNVIYQADSSKLQAYRTYDNVGKNRELYFRGMGALPPGGKYFFVLGAQYNHNFYRGLYDNAPLSFKKGTWTFFTYHTLTLDKRSVLTLNGFLRLKGQQNFYELSSFGALNASINRKFLKDKLVLTLSMSDIFATNKNEFTLNQGSVKAMGYRQADTRRVGLNLRYNFGIRKREEGNEIPAEEPPAN